MLLEYSKNVTLLNFLHNKKESSDVIQYIISNFSNVKT